MFCGLSYHMRAISHARHFAHVSYCTLSVPFCSLLETKASGCKTISTVTLFVLLVKKFKLMKQKGIYRYDYIDSFNRFNEAQLPPKKSFYSILNNEHISYVQYQHVQTVWSTFKLKTMGNYLDLYLTSDVLLLADVFENFRKTCLQYYKLGTCHYFTSPGFSFDAMMKMTNIQLELMTDIDMFHFIKKGMRGGISYIANRYGKANNKYVANYD